MEQMDDNVTETINESAKAGDEIKKAYVYKAKNGRKKLTYGLAIAGGAVGLIASGGLAGVALAAGGGLAGNLIGKKAEKKAKERVKHTEFERIGE